MMNRLEEMIEDARDRVERIPPEGAGLLAAFTIGAAVGVALALVWIPERRRSRLPESLETPYRRVRDRSSETVEQVRKAAGRTVSELREELAATLEAAREDLTGMTREHLERSRKVLEREYRNLKR